MPETNYKPEKPLCIGSGCAKAAFARGMCRTHYSRWRIHGHCETIAHTRLPKTCEVDGCDRPSHTRWKKGKAVCNMHWQYLHRYGTETAPPSAPKELPPLCCVQKCMAEVRSGKSPYCEKHYYRIRRGSQVDLDPKPLHQYETSAGYISLFRPEHPLANKSGRVSEHRAVAYELHGGVCPKCFWCGCSLQWGDAVVDHLNEDKADNAPTNLVVACSPCNRARGAMLQFVAVMRPEALTVFYERIEAYRLTDDSVRQREERSSR